jgi:hypothetical protein
VEQVELIGTVESLWRYPVKSMRGEELQEAFVGFARVYGDRLYAFRNSMAPKGFPYLTGRELETMLSEITGLKTNIEVSLRDESGRIICEADGSPSEIGYGNPKGWVTMMGPDEAAYWNGNCLRMRLKPSSSYSLTIHIRDIDPRTPKINLVPTLEGGQPELT